MDAGGVDDELYSLAAEAGHTADVDSIGAYVDVGVGVDVGAVDVVAVGVGACVGDAAGLEPGCRHNCCDAYEGDEHEGGD